MFPTLLRSIASEEVNDYTGGRYANRLQSRSSNISGRIVARREGHTRHLLYFTYYYCQIFRVRARNNAHFAQQFKFLHREEFPRIIPHLLPLFALTLFSTYYLNERL